MASLARHNISLPSLTNLRLEHLVFDSASIPIGQFRQTLWASYLRASNQIPWEPVGKTNSLSFAGHPQCPLCLGGGCFSWKVQNRDTEFTEITQRL